MTADVTCTRCGADDLGRTACGARGTLVAQPDAARSVESGVLTEAEQDALACRCHETLCPLHNEAAEPVVEWEPDVLFATVECILAARSQRPEGGRESVAMALFAWDTEENPHGPTWDGLSDDQRGVWLSGADAALAAQRPEGVTCKALVTGRTDDEQYPCPHPAVEEWLDLTGQWVPVCARHGKGQGGPTVRLRPLPLDEGVMVASVDDMNLTRIGHPSPPGRAVPGQVTEWAEALAAVEAVARVEALHGGTHWCFAGAADDVYERGTEWWPCPTLAALRPEGGKS